MTVRCVWPPAKSSARCCPTVWSSTTAFRFWAPGAVSRFGYSDSGETVGRLTGDGLYSNLQGQNIGFVSPDGYAYRRVGNDYVIDGRLISSKMVIDAGGKFIGSIAPGGKVTDFEGKAIGLIKANGFALRQSG